MTRRVTIDPVTRIEGHLRIDLEVDGGAVRKAWSSGTMWRGFDPCLACAVHTVDAEGTEVARVKVV